MTTTEWPLGGTNLEMYVRYDIIIDGKNFEISVTYYKSWIKWYFNLMKHDFFVQNLTVDCSAMKPVKTVWNTTQ